MLALRTALARRGLAVHAADALLGSEVFTKLPATKTVLCVVATSHNNKSALGLAVTDPYLGHARALEPLAWITDSIESMADRGGGRGSTTPARWPSRCRWPRRKQRTPWA